jgi:class 3 adenylate cyclase
MAELEAFTDIQPSAEDKRKRPDLVPRQFAWRYTLPVGRSVRLGRVPAEADWVVPEDAMISGYHAALLWDGERLHVRRRDKLDPALRRPVNNIWVGKADVAEVSLRPGESFAIGQTLFTVHPDGATAPASPVDAAPVEHKQEATRDQLEGVAFTNPAAALRALEQLPAYIKGATNEQGLFRQMLKVVMDALPRADAAAVVRLPAAAPTPTDARVAVVEQHVRSPQHFGLGGFVPSRTLCHRAVVERKRSCLHFWSADPSPSTHGETEVAMAAMAGGKATPWALCTPFQDGSKYALYITGEVTGVWAELDKPARDKAVADLTQYQKIAELLTGLTETTLRTYRLARQNTVIRQAWPRGIWKHLDDPDRLEAMLRPQEKVVTILFCDLRNYSLFASLNADQLVRAWREVAFALDAMSGTITLLNGVVAGFRGDAVLGFWGWPDPLEKQLEMAAQAAVSISEKLSGWLQEKKCGLGLTHGRAVAGRLGAHDLAVVDLYGPVVNLAFRLEAMTKAFGVGIIVAPEVADRLAAGDPAGCEWRTRRLGRVRAKGFPDPVWASELYSAHSPAHAEWQRADWDAAVDLFTAGRWDLAWEQLDSLFGSDPAAQCLLRVMARTDRKPPPGWDGSFVPEPPRER